MGDHACNQTLPGMVIGRHAWGGALLECLPLLAIATMLGRVRLRAADSCTAEAAVCAYV